MRPQGRDSALAPPPTPRLLQHHHEVQYHSSFMHIQKPQKHSPRSRARLHLENILRRLFQWRNVSQSCYQTLLLSPLSRNPIQTERTQKALHVTDTALGRTCDFCSYTSPTPVHRHQTHSSTDTCLSLVTVTSSAMASGPSSQPKSPSS